MEDKIKLGYLDEDFTNRCLFFNSFNGPFNVVLFDKFEKIRTLDDLMAEIEESDIDVLAVYQENIIHVIYSSSNM